MLGKIKGKSSTNEFWFIIEKTTRKFQYVKVKHSDGYHVLAQVVEIETTEDRSMAKCNILGFRNDKDILKSIKYPLEPGTDVENAEDEFIQKTLGLNKSKYGAYIGKLEGKDIKVYLDLNRLLTRHCSILAKTGSGKCVSPNTKITLSNGEIVNIGNFVDKKLKGGFFEEDGVQIVKNKDANLKVISINNTKKVNSSKILTFMRRKSPEYLYEIKTRTGDSIEVTPEHPIPLLKEQGLMWVRAAEISKGDYTLLPKLNTIKGSNNSICLIKLWKDSDKIRVDSDEIKKIILNSIKKNNFQIGELGEDLGFSKNAIRKWFRSSGIPLKSLIKLCKLLQINFKEVIKPKIKKLRYRNNELNTNIPINLQLAKLLGYMLAEGHNNGKTIGFTNENKEIRGDYSFLVEKVFYISTKKIADETVLMIYNSFLAKTLQKIGFTNSSKTKYLPRDVLSSECEVICSFLSSFIDCDGHVNKNNAGIEITLGSQRLISEIRFILLRLGIISRYNLKLINNVEYYRLTFYGTKNLQILRSKLKFFIIHKQLRLEENSELKSNPNLEIIPNVNLIIRQIKNYLRISNSESGVASINKYINFRGNPTRDSLKRLIKIFDEKIFYLSQSINEIHELYESLPLIDEQYALNLLKNVYNEEKSFCYIAEKTNVSYTTIRRIIRGKTVPTNKVYNIASQFTNDSTIVKINNLDFKQIILKVFNLCKDIGYEYKELCLNAGYNKQLIYNYVTFDKEPLYSTLYKLVKSLYNFSLKTKTELGFATEKLKYLSELVESNLYFDQIVSINLKKSSSNFVYDLETEDHNFTANNILIHNSYSVGVLLEEILERNVPIVVIDPHGEYSTLKNESTNKEGFEKFEIEPKGYGERIREFSPDIKKNPHAKQLTLSSNNLTGKELMHLLPAKLSGSQIGILYSAIKEMGDQVDFDALLFSLQQEEMNAKWSLISIIEYLKQLNIFSKNPTTVHELVQPAKGTIINLKGVPEEVQEMIVYKIIKDLFNARKNNQIPPFFLVVEEAHNFAPERNFKEAKSSPIIRSISAEGRKFGLGLCVVSQRPARLDKNVLSQCNTQIILKLTNPNDLKAISSSVEGVTAETEDAIKNLYIGTAMVVGVVDMPLFVDIRPRMSKHGGDSINILETFAELGEATNMEVLNLIKPNKTLADHKIETGSKNAQTTLVPCYMLNCNLNNHDFNLLINMNNAELIKDIENFKGVSLIKNLKPLTVQEEKILNLAVALNREFGAAELFPQSGVQFTELYDIAKTLAEKNYFTETVGKFKVSQALSFFLNLRNYTCFVQPEFSNITFDRKYEVKYDINLITKFISKFVKINDQKEVWLVKYED